MALFKLAALLHDIAKPATKQPKPGGGVSFHEHQTIGGEMALEVAQRLGFGEEAARYIRLVVREHMRPGQLGVLDEVTQRAVARFFHATAGAGPDVLLHLLADHMATRGPQINVTSWLRQAAWVDALLDTIWGEEIEPTPAAAERRRADACAQTSRLARWSAGCWPRSTKRRPLVRSAPLRKQSGWQEDI